MSGKGRRPASAEGGNARGERARAAIADALIALVDEGQLRPTAAEVAARAGVSERSLYFHFGDAEGLFRAAAERRLASISASLPTLDVALPLERRLPAFTRARVRLLEAITPMRRAALLKAPDSPAVAQGLALVRAVKARQVLEAFAPELRAIPARRRAVAEAAVVVAASWSTWEALRAHQGLKVAEAATVLRALLAAVLGGAGSSGAPGTSGRRRGRR